MIIIPIPIYIIFSLTVAGLMLYINHKLRYKVQIWNTFIFALYLLFHVCVGIIFFRFAQHGKVLYISLSEYNIYIAGFSLLVAIFCVKTVNLRGLIENRKQKIKYFLRYILILGVISTMIWYSEYG